VINDQTFNDAGTFIFRNDGSGFATLGIPGISLPADQPLSWTFDQDDSELTIDYGTGQEEFLYEVTIHSENRVTINHNIPFNSGDEPGISRTIIELSKHL
jgi:hypothetical protein